MGNGGEVSGDVGKHRSSDSQVRGADTGDRLSKDVTPCGMDALQSAAALARDADEEGTGIRT